MSRNLVTSGEDLLDDIIAKELQDATTVEATSFTGSQALETSEPANIQAVLATQFDDFSTGDVRRHAFEPVVGRSIFSSDGAFWAHSRALMRPQFARENINDLEMTDRASNELIEAIGALGSDGWTAPTLMMPLLYNFTLDTATDFLFGESIQTQREATAARSKAAAEGGTTLQQRGSREAPQGVAQEFASAFEIAHEYMLGRIQLQSLYFLSDGPKFRRAVGRIRELTERYVQLAIDTAIRGEKQEGKKQSLMYNLATQTGDRIEVRDQTLSILLAGRDTTASLLGFALIRLALHPDIFAKLRNIVLQDFEPGKEITFASLKGCRYLQHFLNEVLRLHPTVPLNHRIAAKDTTLPTGGGPDRNSPVAVRKGEMVFFSVYIMQRRQDLWGKDAADFKPERWEQRYPAWQFLPFLGGPRICIGQQFALIEASYLIVRLLHEFDAIEPADLVDMRKIKKGLGVTMWPGDGCKVRFHKAGSS